MNETRLARRETKRRGQGEGRTALPLKRKAERERIEQKTRGGDYMGNTIRSEEAAFQKLTADIPKMEKFVEDLDREAAVTNSGTPEMRLSGSRLLDQDAVQLSGSGGFGISGTDRRDYSDAVREAIGNVGPTTRDDGTTRRMGGVHGTEDEMREAVERRMRENPEVYPNG